MKDQNICSYGQEIIAFYAPYVNELNVLFHVYNLSVRSINLLLYSI